ncbi:MAG TPA: methionine synthase [Pseudonocardiaceae bacterium]|nr:methionine synthase [Pseudonocardiaceae bacterium]
MSATPWPSETATAIGSMPGTDPVEATRTVAGELPHLPHLPELPARQVGADIIGRTAGLLIDLPVELVPSGYRVTAHPGHDLRRSHDLLARDLDALQEVMEAQRPALVKVQLAGPWTLAAGVELVRGHRVLTDPGALREFTESLCEGLALHVTEVAARTGAAVLVQIDEPTLPAVLAGALSTPSGLGAVAPVGEPEARDLLAEVVDAARAVSGQPVAVHCCADQPPIALLRAAGADVIAFDATGLDAAPTEWWDEIGETWDAGALLFLGLVPSVEPLDPVTLQDVAKPALAMADRLGFPRTWLAERAVPTPTCGLAGAAPAWAGRALRLTADLAKAFVEPPESWSED